MTLVETLVAVGLLAGAGMLILSLLPTGVLSLKKAERIQTATGIAQELVENAPAPSGAAETSEQLVRELNGTRFTVTRRLRPLGDGIYETHVRVEWSDEAPPVELRLWRRQG